LRVFQPVEKRCFASASLSAGAHGIGDRELHLLVRPDHEHSERPIDPARLFRAETLQRLRAVRAVYDPSELFVSNHPIH
jgi:hypothetical protein